VNFENTVMDLLGRGVGVRFRAKGDSMHPTIRCGEHMHVEPVEASALSRGDVVLARHARGLTAHRIVRIDGTGIITRGDNCSVDDPQFAASEVLGRVKLARARGWVRRVLSVLTNFSRRPRRLFAAAGVLWQSVL
jgi:phage repressor protein C with HTH and peptisase S24 domain